MSKGACRRHVVPQIPVKLVQCVSYRLEKGKQELCVRKLKELVFAAVYHEYVLFVRRIRDTIESACTAGRNASVDTGVPPKRSNEETIILRTTTAQATSESDHT